MTPPAGLTPPGYHRHAVRSHSGTHDVVSLSPGGNPGAPPPVKAKKRGGNLLRGVDISRNSWF